MCYKKSILLLFLLLCIFSGCSSLKDERDVKPNVQNESPEEQHMEKIRKVEIKVNTDKGRYCKQFVEQEVIQEISNMISDSIGEEVDAKAIKQTGGWSVSVCLYKEDGTSILVTPYSDKILQVGEKYYSLSNLSWEEEIKEYYVASAVEEEAI